MERPDWQRLFESSSELALVLDTRLQVVAVTDPYLEAARLSRDDVIGRDVFDVLPEEAASSSASDLRASLRRARRHAAADHMPIRRQEVWVETAEGEQVEERYWRPVNVPVPDREGSLAYIVHRLDDVTDYVRHRAHVGEHDTVLADLQQRLERACTDLVLRSSELEAVNEHLRRASDAKNDFLARMSHELRSPLTAVIGFGELLGSSELDDRQRERLGMIRKASEHLLALMNEVLDLTRIESGSISISAEPLAVEPILQETLALVRPLAEAHEVILHAPDLRAGAEFVFADNQRLKQVLLNLLSNAIKYNRPDGDVRVDVEPEGEDEVRMSVSDTGRGLDAAAMAKLFVPFERLDAPAAGIDGTGLGLVLCRTLLEAMNGRIGVTSEPGRGSRFSVVVPRGTPVTVADEECDDPLLAIRVEDEPRSILYIEDTLANVLLIRGILEHRPNVQLLSAAHGEIGLELAREHRPDLILLDLHLPDLTGEDVLARLRGDPATRDVPVVVLSADARREPASLLAAGASAYLTKPVALRRLLEVVDRFLYEETEVDALAAANP